MGKQRFTAVQRRAILHVHDRRCAYCSEHLLADELEIEHVIPEDFGKKSKKEWEEFCKSHGIPTTFDLNDYDNLLPSCRPCNKKKGTLVLHSGGLAILLARAQKKANEVRLEVEKLKNQNLRGEQLFAVIMAVDQGQLTRESISIALNQNDASKGKFNLSYPFNLHGDVSLRELSVDDLDKYLDATINLPWLEDGLVLHTQDGIEVKVRTLREYMNETAKGSFAYSNAAMKIAAAVFERPLKVLNILRQSKPCKKSFVDDPHRGISDIDLLPVSLLSDAAYYGPGFDELPPRSIQEKTIAELVRKGEATVTQVGSDHIGLRYADEWTYMFEIMRTDVNDDGVQDLLISRSGGPLMGTLQWSEIIAISRFSDSDIFHVTLPSTKNE